MADEDTPGPSLAERLDALFRSARRPDGRTYSNQDVARELTALGVEISAPYVWQLRTGRRDNPSMRHLQALARFFQVDPAYFFPTEAPDVVATELVGALRRDGVRDLALGVADLSPDTLAVLGELVGRVRTLEGLSAEPVA